MPRIAGKRAFLELLRQEGVELIFGNPGTTELPLMDALAVEEGIGYVLGLQEAAVLAMADGYAQASGRLAVVNLHVAPGLGNAMGMLYDAKKAGSPLLVTAGQHDQSFTFSEPLLWDELPRLAEPLVKWSAEVRRLQDLPRAVHRAAKTALAPPTGPVFLSLPGDILTAEAEIDLGRPSRIAPAIRGDADAIEEAAALLAAAERPVLIAGDIVAQRRAHAELAALAELLGAPVWAEGVPNTASFPASNPLFRGAMTRSQPVIRGILEQHDLLFSVGGDLFTLSLPHATEPVPPDLPIIHLDTDPWEIGKNFAASVAILADPKASLPELAAATRRRMSPAQQEAAAARLAATRRAIAAEREALMAKARAEAALHPLRPLPLLHAVGAALPPEAIIVDETISSGAGLRQLLKSDDPKSFYGLRGGGIGWGLPAAIGVKLAEPRRPVVALIGDGSALYTCQALWTAARQRLAGLVFLILDNGAYRILKQRTNALQALAAQTDRYVGMDLTDPAIDFPGLARSFGIAAERAATIEKALAALRRGLAASAPLLIDVVLDGSFKPV
ncbi:MAG TPA: thiamine pyrophosphate-binding protein [Stellaceae bacterium]|nr:thiamine pyrophosphate-binding protein [Stellaceae bacterium]